MGSKNRFIIIWLILFEIVLLNCVLLLLFFPKILLVSQSVNGNFNNLFNLFLIYNISWHLIIFYVRDKGFYFDSEFHQVKNYILAFFFFVGFASTIVMIFKVEYYGRAEFLSPILIYSFLNFLFHKYLLRFLRNRKNPNLTSNTILIGSRKEIPKLLNLKADFNSHGYNILGYLNHNRVDRAFKANGTSGDMEIQRNIGELSNVLDRNRVDEIFVTLNSLKKKDIKSVIKTADNYGVRVNLLTEKPSYIHVKFGTRMFADLAVYQLRQSPLDDFNSMVLKRLFDVCFSLFVLALLSPLFLLISALIYLENKGPILYKPLRKGEADGTFECYKFRTMYECDNPINGTKSTIKNDPRITRIGKFLRKADLDELPQFFNVLKGDMSVVGPRPHRIHLQDDFRKIVNDYMVRSYVKPGITGWAQVNGWRGPTETDYQKKQRVKYDLWYIENWDFWLDIKIILMTIFGNHHKKAF